MKLTLRRVGNSLGIILPKAVLQAWGLEEGDTLELNDRGIHPSSRAALTQDDLDELKRELALAVVRRFTPQEIRAQSLANLHRWQRQNMWIPAYEEWRKLIERGDDGELYAAMLTRDEWANQLRQSPPYVGLLPREEVRKLNEKAAA
jgi:antitoxin component of MazEF toxin-antitoxin module